LLKRSYKNILVNNTYEETYSGIYLEKSWRNELINNSYENGIVGIYLTNSYKNEILNNNFNGCGLFVEFSCHNDVKGNIVNGKPLVYLEDVTDIEVTDAGQVILINCNGILVKNCDINRTTGAIKLCKSHNCTIENNKIRNSNWGGIHLWHSSLNRISNNTIDKVDEGIHLKLSSNNEVLNNTITNPYLWGIFLWQSSENWILRSEISGGRYFTIFIRNSSRNRIFFKFF